MRTIQDDFQEMDKLSFRVAQLKQEEALDKTLQNCECPAIVARFLLGMRKHNRKLSQEMYKAPFYSIPSVFQSNTQKLIDIQTVVLNADRSKLCRVLDDLSLELLADDEQVSRICENHGVGPNFRK